MKNKFIELTIAEINKPVIVSVDKIVDIVKTANGCFVSFDFDRNGLSVGLDVIESYDKVKSMIM